jgi:UDP-N-acetyl-D-galactosamine dehydrogenase
VPDILHELAEFGIQAMIHDPIANAEEALHEYGLRLKPLEEFRTLDALVLAVAHKEYVALGSNLLAPVRDGGIFVDVKSVLQPSTVEPRLRYWSL